MNFGSSKAQHADLPVQMHGDGPSGLRPPWLLRTGGNPVQPDQVEPSVAKARTVPSCSDPHGIHRRGNALRHRVEVPDPGRRSHQMDIGKVRPANQNAPGTGVETRDRPIAASAESSVQPGRSELLTCRLRLGRRSRPGFPSSTVVLDQPGETGSNHRNRRRLEGATGVRVFFDRPPLDDASGLRNPGPSRVHRAVGPGEVQRVTSPHPLPTRPEADLQHVLEGCQPREP